MSISCRAESRSIVDRQSHSYFELLFCCFSTLTEGAAEYLHSRGRQGKSTKWLPSSGSIFKLVSSKKMRSARHVARRREILNAHKISVWNMNVKPLERPRHRWEYNVRIYIRKKCWQVDGIHLVQNMDKWQAVVGAVVQEQRSASKEASYAITDVLHLLYR